MPCTGIVQDFIRAYYQPRATSHIPIAIQWLGFWIIIFLQWDPAPILLAVFWILDRIWQLCEKKTPVQHCSGQYAHAHVIDLVTQI